MKLSIFTTSTIPHLRGDMVSEPYDSFAALADEVVTIDGSHQPDYGEEARHYYSRWPKEFDWPLIGRQFQKGYEVCTGDVWR